MGFQIGDRVIAIDEYDGNSSIIGECGTIIEHWTYDIWGVEFDNFVNGHNCNGSVEESGKGYYVREDKLKHVEAEPLEPVPGVEIVSCLYGKEL